MYDLILYKFNTIYSYTMDDWMMIMSTDAISLHWVFLYPGPSQTERLCRVRWKIADGSENPPCVWGARGLL
jgi:hypothetical protein